MTTPASRRPCSMNTTVERSNSSCPDNEHNFFKKHSCDDDKEATFLKTAVRKLKFFVNMTVHEEFKQDFKDHLSALSQGMLKLLNCTRKVKGRKQPSLGEARPTKNLEEKKSLKEQRKQEDICFLKSLIDKIKTCWNKILSGTKEH